MATPLETLALSIKQAQDRQHRALDTALAAADISLVQWHALREIERNPGCSQRQLSMLTFNSVQALGTLLARMSKSGLIESEASGGRAITHTLTAAGTARLEQGRAIVNAAYAQLFAGLEQGERDELQRLLGKVLAG